MSPPPSTAFHINLFMILLEVDTAVRVIAYQYHIGISIFSIFTTHEIVSPSLPLAHISTFDINNVPYVSPMIEIERKPIESKFGKIKIWCLIKSNSNIVFLVISLVAYMIFGSTTDQSYFSCQILHMTPRAKIVTSKKFALSSPPSSGTLSFSSCKPGLPPFVCHLMKGY